MDSFTFYNPSRIVFAQGAFNRFAKEFSKLKLKKPLIVIGSGSVKKNGSLNKLTEQLKSLEIDFVLYEGIRSNPTTTQVNDAAALALKQSCDCVIALGGGSVMDASKAIALVVKQGGSAWDYTVAFGEHRKAIKEALPIIAIPTVAATGSEADAIAVLNNPETRQKASISNKALFPVLAIVDPVLTLSCPLKPSMEGVVDIIAHAAETYFSCDKKTPIQDGFTETICKTAYENGLKLFNNLEDLDARTQLSWASTSAMAGFLLGRSGAWPMHAIEHEISAFHPDIAHGAGLAALFVPIIEWDSKKYGIKKLQQFCKNVLNKEITLIEQGIDILYKMLQSIGMNLKLKDLGVKKEDLEALCDGVLKLKGNKKNELLNIVAMTKQDILAVLEKAYS